MHEYHALQCFSVPTASTDSSGEYLSASTVFRIANVLQALEITGLFTVDSYQYYIPREGFNAFTLTKVVMASYEKIVEKLEALTEFNPDKVCGFIFLGLGFLFDSIGEKKQKELFRLQFEFDGRTGHLDYDARDWLPAYLTYNEEKDDYDCTLQFEQYKANRGRLEAALVAVEKKAGLKMSIFSGFDTEPDWGYATEGYSLYVPRRVWKVILQYAPDIDILPYLAPSEAQTYLAEQLSPKIDKLRNIAQSRPLLAREQLELDTLTSVLSCNSLADIDLIINNLQHTPTDPDLRQRLLLQAQNKRHILVEKQICSGVFE